MKRAIAASMLALGLGLFTAGTAQAEPVGALTPGGAISLANVDTKNAAHWQVCGVNVANQSVAPTCDNSHGTGDATGVSDASGSGLSMANVDASDAAHWQVCGVTVAANPASCDNQG